MPASVISIGGKRQGYYVVLEACLAGRPPRTIGVLLVDPQTDRAWMKLRETYGDLADPEDIEVLELLTEDLGQRAREMGATALLDWMEDTLSNAIRVTDRERIEVDAFSRVRERLYGEHVETVAVERFRTHLPLLTLRAAAGGLGEEMTVEPEDWVPAPEGLHLTSDLFVAHVVGKSMEPRIPDGSLNLFRFHPAGSRQNKIVLVERFGVMDETARYTVKRYTSTKKQTGEEEWHHEQIRLEPLNPDFEGWDAGPEDFAVVAEWLRVIE